MSVSPMMTLRDGSQVPYLLLTTTTINLHVLAKENYTALCDLVKKCEDESYKLVANPSGNSEDILRKWQFIDANGKINPNVSKIVLNSIEREALSLVLVNPMQSKSVTVVEQKTKE